MATQNISTGTGRGWEGRPFKGSVHAVQHG